MSSTAGHPGRQWIPSFRLGVIVLGLAAALAGCQTSPRVAESVAQQPDRSEAQPPADVLQKLASLPSEPVSRVAVRTTDGEIYTTNINAQIATLRQRIESTPDPRWKQQYASLLYFRARLLGDASDFDRSQSVVEGLLVEAPNDVKTRLLAARLASALHRFDESALHLARARELGSDTAGLGEAESQLALALGRVSEALQWATQQEASANDLTTLAYLANLAVLRGDLPEAERLFSRAERRFAGTGPYLLSWLHTQHGIALLKNDQIERANRYFRAAHERLPAYYLATEHLAETELLLGNAAEALALYEQVYQQTSNPEFLAPLAEAQKALGRDQTAALTLKRAHQAWQQMISSHPQASWQHAAEFYLEEGGQPAEALRLARLNIALRKDVGSWLLLARAEHASGGDENACKALSQARSSGLNPPDLVSTAAALESTCGKAAGRVD